MGNHILTERNFIIFAATNYNNPSCVDTREFVEDIARFKYIKKLITRYTETGELKYRLILNHIIVLSNVFQPEPLCRMVLLKMEDQIQYVKPFLVMLGIMIENIHDVKIKRTVDTTTIVMDPKIIDTLRTI